MDEEDPSNSQTFIYEELKKGPKSAEDLLKAYRETLPVEIRDSDLLMRRMEKGFYLSIAMLELEGKIHIDEGRSDVNLYFLQ